MKIQQETDCYVMLIGTEVEPHKRIEFIHPVNGHQFKKICYTDEELERVLARHANPNDVYSQYAIVIFEVDKEGTNL